MAHDHHHAHDAPGMGPQSVTGPHLLAQDMVQGTQPHLRQGERQGSQVSGRRSQRWSRSP